MLVGRNLDENFRPKTPCKCPKVTKMSDREVIMNAKQRKMDKVTETQARPPAWNPIPSDWSDDDDENDKDYQARAGAMLQQPYLSKKLSSPPPQNPNNWIHSVIFEPQPKIQLTCSSYKVTSFLDFQPFIHGFQSVNNYLDNLWTDIQDHYYFRYLFVPLAHVVIDPTINKSHIENF